MLKSGFNMLAQLIIIITLAPLVNGIIKKIKAKSQHRIGAPILQLYYDLFKLFKKSVVISETTSWIFIATPYIYIVSILITALFIPAIPQFFSFGFMGDAILVVYLLAMSRFFVALSGLDAGSTFGGMGSSREMMISSLIEPSLVVVLFTLGLNPAINSTSFKAIYEGSLNLGLGIINPVYFLMLVAMFIILIAETARIPVDDPATHLELTMVHEAMILEYSGRHLAFIELSASIKQLLIITLIANVFIPIDGSIIFGDGLAFWALILINLVLYTLKVFIITVFIGIIEINSVKLRLFSVPNLAALAFILSLLGFMSSFMFGRR